ncbi:MAG: arylsulfatase [Bryobacterales bacterium]|nr:arylsulfatase [Bryobacterales bacterium]
MNRRAFLASIGGAAVTAAQTSAAKPNVVILLADDLGWADVGFHSSEIRTPNLDGLARQSLEIERFYSCPLCSPTRSALMTGRYPLRFGIQYTVVRPWAKYGLPLDERTIADVFRAGGYETAMAGKWHLGHFERAYLPGARGFDHSYGHVNGAIDYYTHDRDGGADWHRNGQPLEEPGYTTELVGREAVARIEKRNKQKPLFLYVPFNAPHTPLQAPKETEATYAAAIADPKRRTFAAMVTELDTQVGRILDALDREKMAGNTIVLFFSDNGGPTGSGAKNYPLRGAKGSTWEGGMRVPALLRYPGVLAEGLRLPQVMTAMDVLPTLAGAAGISPAGGKLLDGKNLWPALKARRADAREDLFFAVDSAQRTHYAVYSGEWKLVREEPSPGKPNGAPATVALFHIAGDPRETKDLAAANAPVVQALTAKLDEWKKLHPATGLRFSAAPPAGFQAPRSWIGAAR